MKTRKLTVKLCGVMLCVLAVYSVARNVCAKCIMTINYRSLAVNTTAVVPENPFSLVLRPFQKEQLQIVYTDGSRDEWKDTQRTSEAVYINLDNESAPYTDNITLPGYGGIGRDWPEKIAQIHVSLQQPKP